MASGADWVMALLREGGDEQAARKTTGTSATQARVKICGFISSP
jgi:hypothetical protein